MNQRVAMITMSAAEKSRLVKAVIIHELMELADQFEGAGPDALWTGSDIAKAIGLRIRNHHFEFETTS